MKTSVKTIYDLYLEVFPQESEALALFTQQLQEKGEASLLDSKHFEKGHITVSSIVVSMPSKYVLLIDHAVLQRTLQPGGHISPTDETLLAAAYRECLKEARIPAEKLTYIALSDQNQELPFSITVREVPANSAKDEPAHYHYDFSYLFVAQDGTEITSRDDDASNPQWTPFAVFAENTDFSRQSEKIDKLLATL